MSAADEQQQTRRRDWTRCGWCWAPIAGEPTLHRGTPYCGERCAGHELPSDTEPAPVGIADDQLELGAA